MFYKDDHRRHSGFEVGHNCRPWLVGWLNMAVAGRRGYSDSASDIINIMSVTREQ